MQSKTPDQTGRHGPEILWLAGPPFSPDLLTAAADRAGGRVVPLLDPEGRNDVQAVAARLLERLRADHRVIVVAHGLAVRAARLLAGSSEAVASGLCGVVLSNGPITRLDPVTAALIGLGPLLRTVLSPRVILPWLRSSLGLRRAVRNPYVMDHDTVAAICGPLFADRGARRAVADYLCSLNPLPPSPPAQVPLWLVWGDDDPLYPLAEADSIDAIVGGGRVRTIPGGRFGHPEERPWALADHVSEAVESLNAALADGAR